MSKSAILVTIAVGVVVLAIILVSILVINMKKSKKSSANSAGIKNNSANEKKVTINDMLKIAKAKNSSKEDLTKAVVTVAKELPFPPKMSKNGVSREAKKYLDFVFLVSAHPNSDAQLIAFMNKELKAKNPSYKMEIDVYEDRGVNGRIKKAAV